MVKKINLVLKSFLLFFSVLFVLNFVSAWDFYGYTYDTNGNALNNTIVNITFYTISGGPPTLVGSNSSTSNESGWFNFSVTSNESWFYKPVINHFNSTTNAIDYIGQSLPQFPYSHFINTTNINFYSKEAGTINITAINSTGDRINFTYAVKDTKLGFPIASEYITSVSEAVVYVPRDRNYSVMIFPEMALPISFNCNNFSSNSSYDIVAGLSTYNVTTHTVQKTFNATDNLIRLTGYINATNISGWDEFTVVPFLLEPGDMIYIGGSNMPYNMSAWNGQSDYSNLTTGFYNITLPGPAESATYILFATARNGTSYYGGYKNITLSYSSSGTESNFTMYSLISTDWASANSNISLDNPTSSGSVNISSAKQSFTLINSTNSPITQSSAFIELKVDYSNYGAKEFTFVTQLSSGTSSFYVPLLNVSIKEMNIFSNSYAPKRVGTRTASQILSNSNITLNTFNPGNIDEDLAGANIFIKLHKSNSTCDLPSASDSCNAVSGDQTRDDFNPLSAVMGGGKLNFRMGYSGIEIVYVNVDMIASGPPDVSFDDSEYAGTTTGNFETAFRFGSSGPTIYDYVLVSMPYTEGSTSQTGLNENADVNMSIPILYDENWNIIWNASTNGINGTALAGNNTHYSTYSSQWETLMGQNNCTRNESELNATNPCYIDTTNNRIWIRLPHFSGTQPSITGNVITATSTSSTSTPSSSGGGYPTFSPNSEELNEGYQKIMYKNWKVSFKVNNESHTFKVEKVTETNAKISISSETQEATISIGEEKKFELSGDNYYDVLIRLNSLNSLGNKANFTIQTIHEKIISQQQESETEDTVQTSIGDKLEEIKSLIWLWILIGVIILGILAFILYNKKKK
ncbi:MAG: hypothetical protein U9Q06_02040 [Nanoarchaeota archaeon]|nr:hypothetical protein [Nanoarchaeota archaeon]